MFRYKSFLQKQSNNTELVSQICTSFHKHLFNVDKDLCNSLVIV